MINPRSLDMAASPAASAVVAALERAWQQIRTYHPQLPQVIVIVAAGGETAHGLFKWGHFAAGRWHVAGTNRPEVLVGGEGLRRPAREVLGTLLHEAAHGLAHARRIQDTSRQGRYHCHKMNREALVPIDEQLQQLIGEQQQRVLDRWPGGVSVLFPRPLTNPDGHKPIGRSTYGTPWTGGCTDATSATSTADRCISRPTSGGTPWARD